MLKLNEGRFSFYQLEGLPERFVPPPLKPARNLYKQSIDKSKDIPCFAKPGDKVKFFQISEDEYKLIEKEVELDLYELNKEVLND